MMPDPLFGDIGSQMRQMEDVHSHMMEGLFGFQHDHRHGSDVV